MADSSWVLQPAACLLTLSTSVVLTDTAAALWACRAPSLQHLSAGLDTVTDCKAGGLLALTPLLSEHAASDALTSCVPDELAGCMV